MAILLFICVPLWTGCDSSDNQLNSNGGSEGTTKPLTVNVMRVTREVSAIETAVFFGKLNPNRKNELVFDTGGRIKSVFKQVGNKATVGQSLAELDRSELDSQKGELEQQLLLARQKLSSTDADSTSIQQEVKRLEAQLKVIELERAKGVIEAPFDCVVARQYVDEGSLVSPQTPILQVLESSPPTVETHLPRRIADQLTFGQLLWISVGEQVVQAKVQTKSPIETSTGSRAVLLRITTDVSQLSWAFGQTVEIRFSVPTGNSGFWIPMSALNSQPNGLWSALLISGDKDEQNAGLPVTVGRKMLDIIQLEDDWALTQGPLKDGEQVIVNGSHRVVPGQKVTTTDITDQFEKPGLGASE